MESSLKLVSTVRLALLASIVIYAAIGAWVQPYTSAQTWTYFYVISGLAALAVEGIFFFRRKILKPSEQILSVRPEDVAALRRWRTAHVGIYAICESVALW